MVGMDPRGRRSSGSSTGMHENLTRLDLNIAGMLKYNRLAAISDTVGPYIPLVLHGTHGVSNEVLLDAVKAGVRKVNLNKTVRHEYGKFVGENSKKLELTKLQEKGVEVYTSEIAALMDVLGSSGKV